MADLDRGSFWRRFDQTAPVHLRLGVSVAGVALVQVLPRLMGHARSLSRLDPAPRDAVLRRAGQLPVFDSLVMVGRIVACLGYFDDAAVQDQVWSGRPL
jgi:hypothetical protein